MKKCPPGEYYCNNSKKCKKIPSGYHIGARGYLAKDDDKNGKKNGNGNGTNGYSNGNGNGSNGGGNGGGVSESTYLPRRTGNIIDVYVGWRGKGYMIKMFFPQIKKPSRREVLDQVRKVYPGAQLWSYQVSNYEPGEPLLQTGGRN
jgi:hypothetical protein